MFQKFESVEATVNSEFAKQLNASLELPTSLERMENLKGKDQPTQSGRRKSLYLARVYEKELMLQKGNKTDKSLKEKK